MLEFLVDNIFVVFAKKGFPADSRYSNGNKLCPSSSRHISLLIWSRIYTVFALNREETGWRPRFNFTYRYIDDVLSINNPEFENYLGQMYPVELEIQRHNREHHFCFIPGFILSIGSDGQLHTSINDKRDDFNFHITNFPFLSSNIPTSPAYGVFISQLIRYARALLLVWMFYPEGDATFK